MTLAPEGGDLRQAMKASLSVQQELTLSFLRYRQYELVPFQIGWKLGQLNGHRSDRPRRPLPAYGHSPVRRPDLSLEGACGTFGYRGIALPDDDALVALAHEEAEVTHGCTRCESDGVPLTRRRQPGDAALDPAEGPRVPDVVEAAYVI